MSNGEELRQRRKENAARDELLRLGWYHSFRFDDGTEFRGVLSVESSQHRYAVFPIPADLKGKRLLDIGAWDGWFSFEAERHGAEVTAIDMVEVPNFLTVHRKLGSKIHYLELDLFESEKVGLGKFDYVFFLGVLYHTKYPLLALEIVCGLTSDIAIVESYVTDADEWQNHRSDIPTLEFYEAEELGGQLDNWFGPTVGCLQAMCRAAGFCRTEILEIGNNRAAFACYRKWPEARAGTSNVVTLRSVTNTIRRGLNFRRTREEYITWWFDFPGESLDRDDVRLEVGEFGVPAMYITRVDGQLWSVNSRLPPGLDAGWYSVRVSILGGLWSIPLQIAVDIPPHADSLEITLVCDGRTWTRGEVELSATPAHFSLWVTGLGENCDEANTAVWLDDRRLKVSYISKPDEQNARQVNAELPHEIAAGEYKVTVSFGGARSGSKPLLLRFVST